MDSNPGTTTEFEAFKPYFMELFEKGMEQGIEKGYRKRAVDHAAGIH